MMEKLLTFAFLKKQTCGNCKVSLEMNELLRNVIAMTDDAYGIPTVMVRCPVCKTPMEWETSCN
ncbi:MAG: hypothetical protein A2Y97_11365 [Nitrospirae bacterium RBG_13_39_12]|nr:MAG: hypothetical protein A2Y97_11365 [Nitrospirae bacterium RBG_13_39_12]